MRQLTDMGSYWFKSSIFEVEVGEDEETNPRCYGKQPAEWIRKKLLNYGYDIEEVIPEDWGWCVMCSRDPYMLWIGCRSMDDYDTTKPGDPPPTQENLIWNCIVEAEVPFFKRLLQKIDTKAGLEKLNSDLKEVLELEPLIEIIDEPE